MTLYQSDLLREAKDMWLRGHPIPLDLYSRLLQEGFDVVALEDRYLKKEDNNV